MYNIIIIKDAVMIFLIFDCVCYKKYSTLEHDKTLNSVILIVILTIYNCY